MVKNQGGGLTEIGVDYIKWTFLICRLDRNSKLLRFKPTPGVTDQIIFPMMDRLGTLVGVEPISKQGCPCRYTFFGFSFHHTVDKIGIDELSLSIQADLKKQFRKVRERRCLCSSLGIEVLR